MNTLLNVVYLQSLHFNADARVQVPNRTMVFATYYFHYKLNNTENYVLHGETQRHKETALFFSCSFLLTGQVAFLLLVATEQFLFAVIMTTNRFITLKRITNLYLFLISGT